MNLTPTIVNAKLAHLPPEKRPELGVRLAHFLDVIGAATGRATAYNTRQEQQAATQAAHEAVFAIDRGIYSAALLLPGVLDHARQEGIRRLLAHPRHNGEPSLLPRTVETQVIQYLTNELPAQRAFKLFGSLKAGRVNNARTRKLILREILNLPDLEWSALKYRRKLRAALTHAWGERPTGIIRSILGNVEAAVWSETEAAMITRHIEPYLDAGRDLAGIIDPLCFILDALPAEKYRGRFRDFYAARANLAAGQSLPPEVLEGIRSTYHPDQPPAKALKLTQERLTTGQQIAVQRSAKAKGVEVEFDPRHYNAVQLYVYAYELDAGLDPDIDDALALKGQLAARSFPFTFDRLAVIIDTSWSMRGHKTQKYRPIAQALAARDMLVAASKSCRLYGQNGHGLPALSGETRLAHLVPQALEHDPEAVFILSDGYENAPAGRLAETLDHVRRLGIETPIYHLNPVMAAEAVGVRQLAPGLPTLPLSQNPAALGLGLMKLALTENVELGLTALLNLANNQLPILEGINN